MLRAKLFQKFLFFKHHKAIIPVAVIVLVLFIILAAVVLVFAKTANLLILLAVFGLFVFLIVFLVSKGVIKGSR